MKRPKNLAGTAAAALIALAAASPSLVAIAADEVGEAYDASIAAQKAAKESQARIDRLEAETRAIREKRKAVQWRAMQLASYAEKLEAEAALEVGKRKDLEAQLKSIATTGTDLMPLMRKMVAELSTFIEADLPFLLEARRARVKELEALLESDKHGTAEKFRRVVEAYRTEVDYGQSLGAEDAKGQCEGGDAEVTLVRVGRIGLYCTNKDGSKAYAWDGKGWKKLDDADQLESVRNARAVARAEQPPQLLKLPVRAASSP